MARTWFQLLTSCVVLGAGVGMLLTASLGSDGYATLISGLSIALSLDFWVVNLVVGLTLVAIAWSRGLTPGLGTVLQPLVVGLVVSAVTSSIAEPEHWWARATMLVLAMPVLALGVAGYLAADAGAGPVEAAAITLDPPIPFRWSYSVVQGVGAVVGWACGAAVGPGTIFAIVCLGPLVSWLSRTVPALSADTTAQAVVLWPGPQNGRPSVAVCLQDALLTTVPGPDPRPADYQTPGIVRSSSPVLINARLRVPESDTTVQ